ncbi:MAG: DUF2795 domain-containing protein [Dehalococcoidia bacterium]
MPEVNPINVQKFLGGIDYPVEKQQLVEHAQDQGADDEVGHALERPPMDRFNSPNDLSEAIGKLRP